MLNIVVSFFVVTEMLIRNTNDATAEAKALAHEQKMTDSTTHSSPAQIELVLHYVYI